MGLNRNNQSINRVSQQDMGESLVMCCTTALTEGEWDRQIKESALKAIIDRKRGRFNRRQQAALHKKSR